MLIVNQTYSSQQGITLVEALVAMAIFMLGFGSLYVFFNLSQHSVVESERRLYLNLMATVSSRPLLPKHSGVPQTPRTPL